MSASSQRTHDLARGDSLLPRWVKEAVRAVLDPVVRLAMALRLTPNAITVLGLLMVAIAAVLVANGQLLLGALDPVQERGPARILVVGPAESGEGGEDEHQAGDAGGAVLVVPQFTLYGDVGRGRRGERAQHHGADRPPLGHHGPALHPRRRVVRRRQRRRGGWPVSFDERL